MKNNSTVINNFMVIKDKEFAVLCGLSGIEHFYGSIDFKEQLTRQEIYKLVYGLYQKEMLTQDEDGFTLTAKMKEIFILLKESERMISVVNPLTSENHAFYFNCAGEACINIQKAWDEPDSLKIRKVKKEDIMVICKEDEMFPKQVLNEKDSQVISISSKDHVTKEYLEINVQDLGGDKLLGRINIRMEGLNEVLAYESEGERYKKPYVFEQVKTLLNVWTKEEM